jgi:hypothetical protein
MISPEFQEQVMQYLNLNISLEELEKWLAPFLYDFLADPDSADAKLAGTIELGLADLANGVRTEDEFRNDLKERLLALLSNWRVINEPDILTGAATKHTLFQAFSLTPSFLSAH